MANQIGKRYRCTKCGVEFIVTKGGDGAIHCCDQPMEQKKQTRTVKNSRNTGGLMTKEVKSVGSQLGKRYRCQVCGTEVLCVKGGPGIVTCCGQEVEIQQPKTIPSSD